MRSISIRQHVIPLWLVATLLLSGVFGKNPTDRLWVAPGWLLKLRFWCNH